VSSCYSKEELSALGFQSLGDNLRISRRASFYNTAKISIASNVRIDDFCIVSAGEGGVAIGNFIHIAAYTSIIGGGSVHIEDFANISARVSIYSSNDDYSGEYLTGPMIPSEYTKITRASVHIKRHTIIGCGSVILPNVVIGEGAAIGALSLVKDNCIDFGVYCGVPAKLIKARKRDLLELENTFLSSAMNSTARDIS
jgi:galactoside O-acetyltransferase